MKKSSVILGLLVMFLFSCGSKHTDYEAALAKASLRDRSNSPYFTQETFEWSLITPDQVPLYVLEAGRGEKVIVLHGGFGMEHRYMRTFLRPFEQDYHMIYYDQRGSLRSPVPENDFDTYITMDNMVNDLELLRKEVGEEKVTLLAHSMGAVLAYEYMRKYPDKVGHLIIISGFVPKFPVTKAGFHDMFQSQQERAEFKTRPAVIRELNKLKASMDTTSRAYNYLHWKINYASCQIRNIENWQQVEGGLGFFKEKADGKKLPLTEKISDLEEQFDPRVFHRINRSEIVNVNFIEKIEGYFNDRLAVTINGQKELLISSAARTPEFRKWLNQL